jgi:hypothetical protein
MLYRKGDTTTCLEVSLEDVHCWKRKGLDRFKAEKGRKFASIDDFLWKNFEMTIKKGSENIPFLNLLEVLYQISYFKVKSLG